MLFRQCSIYELGESFNPDLASLEMMVASEPARACQYMETSHLGFAEPFESYGRRLYSLEGDRVIYLHLLQHERVLPAKVVKDYAAQRIREREQSTGVVLARREKKEIEQAVYGELLSQALQKTSSIQVIFDLVGREMWVDQTSSKKLDHTRMLIGGRLSGLEANLVSRADTPAKLKNWALSPDETLPSGLAIGDSMKLSSEGDDAKASVTVKHELLEAEDWLRIIQARDVEELELVTNDVAFVLTCNDQLKRINSLHPEPEIDDDDRAGHFYAHLWETMQYIRGIQEQLRGAQAPGESQPTADDEQGAA